MRIYQKGFAWVLVLTAVLTLCACAGGQKGTAAKDEAAKTDSAQVQSASIASIESVRQVKPLAAKFDNVVFKELKTTDEIRIDYAEAVGEFEASVISNLKSKNAFARVEREMGAMVPGKSLKVGMNITDMRIASFGARFWGGAFAGNSYMNVELDLVDADSGRSLRTEKISSSNNAWGAAYSFGGSDRSLPTDMGQIVAEYLYTVVPGNK